MQVSRFVGLVSAAVLLAGCSPSLPAAPVRAGLRLTQVQQMARYRGSEVST